MTKLCSRGKAAAKRKFAVYPSAYANAYASKICAGKIKDPSGTKRKDFKGPKPSGAKVGMAVTAGSQSGVGRLEKSGLAGPYSTNTKKDIPRTKPKSRGSKNKSIPTYRAKDPNTYDQGGSVKINKVVKGLKKASKTHAAQAKTLQSIKASKGTIMEKRDIRKVEHMTGKNENKFRDLRDSKRPKGDHGKTYGVKGGSTARGRVRPKQLSKGGICRGGGAAIRGLNFQGIK